jgi:hypothetical protein
MLGPAGRPATTPRGRELRLASAQGRQAARALARDEGLKTSVHEGRLFPHAGETARFLE